jgi:putative two-component system response regulator
LAEQLKISGPYAEQIEEGFIRNIYRASPLHDIGMVVVPEEILRRPASITANEREQIALHTEAGAELLARALRKAGENSLFAQVAINIARYHHERFDGRGYPSGLAGENIPLEARIVAAADTFDALTSPRVYRQPVSSDEALRIMAEEAGKQLDPVIVEALLESAEEFAGAVQYFRGTSLKSLLSSP